MEERGGEKEVRGVQKHIEMSLIIVLLQRAEIFFLFKQLTDLSRNTS